MKKSAIIVSCLVLLGSCEHIFKTDVHDPRLPELNNDHKRVAGALVDDGVGSTNPSFT